ncbi:MAG: ATPase, T2SS/T4P/T4SS family [Deltaproteobacteria bacterium]|nr:ATPase, T2SS/T4P/T4SS family [Deltaproteobacteria bacterium]
MKKRIGDILIDMGFIAHDQLKMALMESRKTGVMLGDVLRRLDWVTEEDLQMAIAVQSGAQILDTEHLVVDQALLARIPPEIVNEHAMLPFALEDNCLSVATSNPFDVIARDKLERLIGCRVKTYIARTAWIANATDLYYKTAQTIDDEIEAISFAQQGADAFKDDQIVNLSNLLIEKGRVLGASDIHIVPDAKLVRINYRIDGVLHQKHLFAKAFQQPLLTRYKIMADMDISNPNIPHDGRIRYKGRAGEFDIRVSTFPTQLGETLVMRLLIHNNLASDLKDLGFEDGDLNRFKSAIQRPYGLVLTTGPTGSGKTTTLYCALMTVNNPSINCMTVEDPIEYNIPTIRQTAVNAKAGLTFGNALRSALRQDPDFILVGEIRDKETADLALQASLTGHLVLSTLHTNDAASAINRMLDLGVNAGILASALTMVLAQRLLRLLCTKCAVRQPIGADDVKLFEAVGEAAPADLAQAAGCESCHAGYRGRTAVYEVIQVDRTIAGLIFSGGLKDDIRDAAVQAGTTLMYAQAIKKVARHLTSLKEVSRVIVKHE